MFIFENINILKRYIFITHKTLKFPSGSKSKLTFLIKNLAVLRLLVHPVFDIKKPRYVVQG